MTSDICELFTADELALMASATFSAEPAGLMSMVGSAPTNPMWSTVKPSPSSGMSSLELLYEALAKIKKIKWQG